jgi:hypothetical protein
VRELQGMQRQMDSETRLLNDKVSQAKQAKHGHGPPLNDFTCGPDIDGFSFGVPSDSPVIGKCIGQAHPGVEGLNVATQTGVSIVLKQSISSSRDMDPFINDHDMTMIWKNDYFYVVHPSGGRLPVSFLSLFGINERNLSPVKFATYITCRGLPATFAAGKHYRSMGLDQILWATPAVERLTSGTTEILSWPGASSNLKEGDRFIFIKSLVDDPFEFHIGDDHYTAMWCRLLQIHDMKDKL